MTTTTRLEPTDIHGNAMTGDPATIERYDRAIDRLVRFHPEAVDLATELAGRTRRHRWPTPSSPTST